MWLACGDFKHLKAMYVHLLILYTGICRWFKLWDVLGDVKELFLDRFQEGQARKHLMRCGRLKRSCRSFGSVTYFCSRRRRNAGVNPAAAFPEECPAEVEEAANAGFEPAGASISSSSAAMRTGLESGTVWHLRRGSNSLMDQEEIM